MPEDARGREVGGVVRRGEDLVAGAVVRADPTPGFASATSADAVSTITDAAGFFGGLRPIALRYDLSVKLGEDLLYYRSVARRYIEPSLEGPRVSARAYTARAVLRLDRAVPEGRAIALFASGDGVLGVAGQDGGVVSVLQQRFTTHAAIHVLEYESSGGFEQATAYGKAELTLDASVTKLADVTLAPIGSFVEPTFSVSAPAGLAPAEVEIRFSFTRTSGALLATVPLGSPTELPAIPNAGYTCRARAARDGAVSDTGEVWFDPYRPVTELTLPAPPVAVAPLDGEARAPGESLLVDGEGVFEHILTPEGGGRTLRIITRQRDATLPDPALLGARPASGPHSWTVRSFPSVRFAEDLSGLDARRHRASGASAPRTVTLR